MNYLQFRSELFVLVCKSVQQNPHYLSIQILVNNEQYQSFQQNSMLYFDLLDFNILWNFIYFYNVLNLFFNEFILMT